VWHKGLPSYVFISAGVRLPLVYWGSGPTISEVTLGYGTYPKAIFEICQVETHNLCNYFSRPAAVAAEAAVHVFWLHPGIA